MNRGGLATDRFDLTFSTLVAGGDRLSGSRTLRVVTFPCRPRRMPVHLGKPPGPGRPSRTDFASSERSPPVCRRIARSSAPISLLRIWYGYCRRVLALPDRVDAVLLDVGGVLVVPDPALLGPVLAAHGGDGSVAAVIRAHYGAMCDADDGLAMDWDRYDVRLAERSGVPADRVTDAAEAVRAAFATRNIWDHELPGTGRALTDLVRSGIRVAVVSNSDGTVERMLAGRGICSVDGRSGARVDLILDSAVVGVAKPDPAIFIRALECLGVAARRAVHVGDMRFADVVGAGAAGVTVLHIDPYADCPDPDGHHHVRDLADVAAVLRR